MRICVVDDEREVRISIIQKLTQVCPNEEIFDVGFGHEALEQISFIRPDLIFLDIRMPEIDGLELLQQLKTTYPFMHVVIISGYDDFEYARRALQWGATDYLLKPADRKQLKANVDRVKQEHERVFRQQFELLESKHPHRLLRFKDLTLYNLSLWFNERQRKTALFAAESQQQVDELMRSPQQLLFAFSTANGVKGVVARAESPVEGDGFSEREQCLPYLAARISLVEQRLFFGSESGSVRRTDPAAAQQAQLLRRRMISAVVKGEDEVLEAVLDNWFVCLVSMTLPDLRRECAQLIAAVDGGMTRQEQEVLVLDEESLYYWHAWVSDYQSWEELKEGVSQLVIGGVTALHSLSRQAEASQGMSWFEQAVKLLEQSTDPDISLESVAEAVNVHPVTLSRMFKQQMGVTFVRYLTARKLQLASELLLTTDKRINDISDEIGYSDYRYFRTLFKKEFGHSPSEHRARHGLEGEEKESG